MTDGWTGILNGYERKARLYPAILAVAPAVLACLMASDRFPDVLRWGVATILGTGGTLLLVQLGRDAGKRIEPELFAAWGGQPSIAILRHGNGRLNPITKARLHARLARAVPEAPAPSPEQESHDPKSADAVYSAWCDVLRAKTRDTSRYRLLLQENITYGFRRNMLGLRPWGVSVATLSAAAQALQTRTGPPGVGESDVVRFASLILLFVWVFVVNEAWVRVAAEEYARRLVETVDIDLPSGPATGARR